MAANAGQIQDIRNQPGALFVAGGIIGGLSAWMWTTTPIGGGFLFGGTSLLVYVVVYEGSDFLGNSRVAQLTRFALGVLAGAAAGAAVVSSLLGFVFTIEAAQTLTIAMIVTTLLISGLCTPARQPQQHGAAAQQQRA